MAQWWTAQRSGTISPVHRRAARMAALFLATAAAGWLPAEASAANKAPVCRDLVSSVAPGGSRALPLSCSDPDGRPQPVEYDIVGEPASGELADINHATLTVRYTPGSFTGTTTLTYRGFDGEDWSNVATHEIRVTSEQQAPVCDPTPLQAIDGWVWTVPCLDPDEGDAVSVEVVDPQPEHGTARVF